MPDEAGAFFGAAIRLAAQIATCPDSAPRRAAFLRLHQTVFTSVAEYDESGPVVGGSHNLADFPDVARAVVTGEVQVIDWADPERLSPAIATLVDRLHLRWSVFVPVISDGSVLGIMTVSARDGAGLRDLQIRQLVTLAQLVALGISHAAKDSALREEADLSQGLERMKGDFLNIAAHELRSPLGIINGYVSMLLDGTVAGSDQPKALLRIAEKSDEMGRLITEMLETARMEAIGLDLNLGPVDLLDVIDTAMRTTEPLVGARHRIATRGPREPLPMVADGMRMATMMINLIDNAIKYSPGGGDIEVAWSRKGGVAQVSVSDHGVGISQEQQSMLFTRFGRLVTPETSHIRGTGLGLYLAREIARLHGGDIEVTSTAGQGTTFTVTMPLVSHRPDPQAPGSRAAHSRV
jgi:signal transduction histidine kinase